MEMLGKIEEIIMDYKPIEKGSVKLETTFEELQLDSLDLVDMAMACEDAFSVTVEVDENLKTVGDLVKIIQAG